MLGRHKFKVGMRVRPSKKGVEANIFRGTYRGVSKATATGVVTEVSEFNGPTVCWSHLKGTSSYAPWFIEPDKRRRKP